MKSSNDCRVEATRAAEASAGRLARGDADCISSDALRSSPIRFTYHRSEIPILLAILVLGMIELSVVHILLLSIAPSAAFLVTFITVMPLAAIAWVAATVRWRPLEIHEDWIRVRAGATLDICIPLNQVEALSDFDPPDVLGRSEILRATVTAHPNLGIKLRTPAPFRSLQGVRQVCFIGICPDDPHAFRVAVLERLAALR